MYNDRDPKRKVHVLIKGFVVFLVQIHFLFFQQLTDGSSFEIANVHVHVHVQSECVHEFTFRKKSHPPFAFYAKSEVLPRF